VISIAVKGVIHTKVGIQKSMGFPRIKYGAGLFKPGMTNYIRLIMSCIEATSSKADVMVKRQNR
jgi:hypothetical protein